MLKILMFMTAFSAVMTLISSFFYTRKGFMTKNTIAFQYLWIILFTIFLSISASLKYPSITYTILIFAVLAIIFISIIYGAKYFAFDQFEKKGLSEYGLRALIMRFKKYIDKSNG